MSKVLLSYRHESSEHLAKVRDLGQRLKSSGVEVILDQFCEDENKGAPNEGWASWSSAQVKQADRILIIASQGWASVGFSSASITRLRCRTPSLRPRNMARARWEGAAAVDIELSW